MEKKTTQRIIGVMVVSSLVVIALPIFFSKNEKHDTSSALPTQQVATPESTPQTSTPSSPVVATEPQEAITANTTTAEAAPTQPTNTANTTTAEAAPTAIQPTTAPPASTAPTSGTTETNPSDSSSVDLTQEVINSAENTVTTAEEVKTTVNEKPAKPKVIAHAKHVLKSHSATWVVQMGSFKNKNNAKNLTNKLRAAGFKAFMSTTKNGNKERTCVLIGPIKKQALATQTSIKVNQAIKMKGIVLPFRQTV